MTTLERHQVKPLQRASNALSDVCHRWVPDPWVIVVLLTGIAAALSFFLTPGGLGVDKAQTILVGWGDGFWGLLEFAMQMAFILMSGYVVASSPPVRRGLIWIADRPAGPKRTVATVALTSMVLTWIHWGIGLVAAGILVRYLAARETRADYRLLVAAAYLGMSGTFHAGLSSSAGLLVATPGHFAEDYFGLIPTSETIFSPFNLALVAITIVVWTVTAVLLHPTESETVRPPTAVREALAQDVGTAQPSAPGAAGSPDDIDARRSPVQAIENSPWVNGTIGTAGLAYVLVYFSGLEGSALAGLTLNSVNFLFLFVGILLHRTPKSLLTAAEKGGSFAWGIILQFPFYAGILGMIVATGLSEKIANAFSAVANDHTYPLFVYWYSSALNFLVPSGGSKFAVEAPYLAEAARTLDVPLDLTVVAYMWGDMATNAIQPFWALPLLAMCGLGFRDIMGFLVVFALVIMTLGSGAFLLAPFFF